MLDWQFVPEPGVFDWRTGVRDRIDAYAPAVADAGQALLWERIAATLRKTVARADPLSAPMARALAAALWQVAVFADSHGLGGGERVWMAEETLELFADGPLRIFRIQEGWLLRFCSSCWLSIEKRRLLRFRTLCCFPIQERRPLPSCCISLSFWQLLLGSCGVNGRRLGAGSGLGVYGGFAGYPK